VLELALYRKIRDAIWNTLVKRMVLYERNLCINLGDTLWQTSGERSIDQIQPIPTQFSEWLIQNTGEITKESFF
jgi:hypothetical protein